MSAQGDLFVDPAEQAARRMADVLDAGATFSADRVYRYLLWRRWAAAGKAWLFIMLNPSTADEKDPDPTVTRCIGYARAGGGSALYVANVFAHCSTDPKELRKVVDPVGPDNDATILRVAQEVHASGGTVVAAWSSMAKLHGRALVVWDLLQRGGIPLHVLKLNVDGAPAHPLYLKADLHPVPWER